jgi:hypothetical protein
VTKLAANGTGIVYSTFLGLGKGNGDSGNGIKVDRNGNAYLTGYIADPMLLGDAHRAFVGKLNPDGSLAFFNQVVNTTSFADEEPTELALDPAGNICISGTASIDTIPIVSGFQTQRQGTTSGFVIVLDPMGQNILYSTYIGTSTTTAQGIAADPYGYLYVTGATTSLMVTANAPQPAGDSDAFVVKINPWQSGANSLVYATYLGGTDYDTGLGITVDSLGDAVITGETKSSYAINGPGFPITSGAYQTDLAILTYADAHCTGTFMVDLCSDAFVAALSPDGGTLLYASYLGNSGPDTGTAVTLDAMGRVVFTGDACGFFPVTANAPQQTAGSCGTAFVAILDLSQAGAAQLVFSTFLGGTGGESGAAVAADVLGNIYVGGWTRSSDFPLVNPIVSRGGANGPSAFIAALSSTQPGSSPMFRAAPIKAPLRLSPR